MKVLNNKSVYLYGILLITLCSCEFELPEKEAAFTCAEPTITTSYDTDVEFFSASLGNLQNVDGFTVIFKYNGSQISTFSSQNTNSTTFRVPVTQRTGSYTAEVVYTNECQQNLAVNRSEAIPEKPCTADPVVSWNQDINGFEVESSRLFHSYSLNKSTLNDIASYSVVLKNNEEEILSFSTAAPFLDSHILCDLTNRTGKVSIEIIFKTTCGNQITRVNEKKIPLYIPMKEINGGSFNIGSTEGNSWETPNPRVTISDFSIGLYEVNVGQWNEVMGGQIGDQRANPSEGNKYRMMPVVNVSWNECQEFINKLNNTLLRFPPPRPYHLPTEAEWEYAAGGGSSNRTRFGNGTNFLRIAEARYDYSSGYNYSYRPWNEFNRMYAEFDTLTTNRLTLAFENDATKPNALGLYNMSGNVTEWCSDYFNYDTYENILNSGKNVNPQGESESSGGEERRIYRGGGFPNSPSDCRVAFRFRAEADDTLFWLGLRLAHD